MAEIVEEGKAQVTSNKVCRLAVVRSLHGLHCGLPQGNTVTRIARDGDPAVKITRKGVREAFSCQLYSEELIHTFTSRMT